MPLEQWRQTILADAPHVLLYPEIGMDPTSVALAAQRLAPVQCNALGHPVTSGCPTLDYYLTSDLMEPPGSAEQYTERLTRLPNLSIYYEPDPPPTDAIARADVGLRPTATVYWSGQSLYKYLPQFDDVYPRIAKAVPDSQFVFIEFYRGSYVTGLFRQRLDSRICGARSAREGLLRVSAAPHAATIRGGGRATPTSSSTASSGRVSTRRWSAWRTTCRSSRSRAR